MQRDTKTAGLGALGALGVGAALMYLLDPDRGARRRKLVADKLVRLRHSATDALDTTRRDLGNRTQGVAARTRGRFQSEEEADDRVIEERVRSELGRAVSHPSAITVLAVDGRVTLAGPVLAREVDDLLSRVGKVRSVKDVEHRLEVHETADGVPALQGGASRSGGRFELVQKNWSPAARLLTAVGGAALTLWGARHKGTLGTAASAAGLALFARGTTNTDLGRLTGVGGRRRGVDIQKTINIAAPVDNVFRYLTQWERWPEWMSHVREVRAAGVPGTVGERTRWVVDGPAGAPIAWDAEVTRFMPNEVVAWKTVEGAPVRHAGTLRFSQTANGGTRVHVQMSYNPPLGAVGHTVATIFGRDPKRQMDDDLARLKTTIESGVLPRDAAQPVTADREASGEMRGASGNVR